MRLIKYSLLISIFLLCSALSVNAQNSLTGDGFGGRSWYVPHNYSVGAYCAYTVCGTDNQLYSWGGNAGGEFGNGTTISSDISVTVPGMNHVKFYTTGYLSAAIKSDSTLWIWGSGEYGQSTGFGNTPVQIATNVKFADGGASHLAFVKYDGTAWAVGRNNCGQLGNGSTSATPVTVPVQMLGIQNAVRVAAIGADIDGNAATLVLMNDGTTKITGGSTYFSTTSALSAPALIPSLTNIVDIKGNFPAGYFLNSAGEVYSFGMSSFGSLGLAAVTATFTPMKITFPPGAAPIVALSSNNDGYHALALDENGQVYAWGAGNDMWGNLGDNTNTNKFSPVLVATNCVDIFAGETFSYLIKADATLWATGQSFYNGGTYFGSIWMNLSNIQRNSWTQIDPTIAPMNLCLPKVVPIELTRFTCAKMNNQSAILYWTSGNEINLAEITVEYSNDSRYFIPIGTVQPKGPNSNYEFIHHGVKGQAYYRLTFIDQDGSYSYSETKKLSFNTDQRLFIAPNPVNDKIHVYSSNNDAIRSIQLFSADGKLIQLFTDKNDLEFLNLSYLRAGLYFIKITTTGNFSEVLKMYKN